MSDRLATYLNNHMSGARAALGMLETLRDQHSDRPLQELAKQLLVEIEADREQLQQIIDHVGGGVGRLKAAAAWLGEKAAPINARLSADPQLGTLEMVEILALGVLGKQALWKALQAVSEVTDRLPPIDFTQLAERAQTQHARLESHRLRSARTALAQ